MSFVFLSSYRNTRESLGELEKAVETLTYLITETEKRIDELIWGCRRATSELPKDS